jgi:hypothetical protein
MDKVLLKYTEYDQPHESQNNSDILETIHRWDKFGTVLNSWTFDPCNISSLQFLVYLIYF